ncbi:MAG: BrnT family toxin [Ardenticatenaceae bacterium]
MKFEWNRQKAQNNVRKHRVSFTEAVTVFDDPLLIMISDPDHSDEEERWLLIGESNRLRLLVVIYTEKGNRIRLISARRATKAERRTYETG